MHPFAVDAAALFDHQHHALALCVCLGQILAKILERVAHPVRLVQTVIAQLDRHGRHGQHQRRHQGHDT